MPTDIHGQPHVGTISLFDDDEEHDAATAYAERHEPERREGLIRRVKRQE